MKRLALAAGLLFALAGSVPVSAAGLLHPKDGSIPPLEILDHKVKVVINNGFAVTEVDQVFHNPHDRDLAATYTFPLPKNASLSELSLWIDGVEVMGEVVEKGRAEKILREETEAGREAAHAAKREYHAFDISLSSVRAGTDARVRLVYLQPLEIESGIGRYVYPVEEGEIDERARSFWERTTAVRGEFTFDCTVHSSYPLDEVRVKGYEKEAVIAQVSPDKWTVWLDEGTGRGTLDRDVVVYYRLAQNLPARVDLLAHRDGDEPGTFLLVVTPGADLETIEEGVDWSVVLDVSGSMKDKLRTAAEAVARAVETMRPQDRFRVVLFANGARFLQKGEWTPVTPDNVQRVRSELERLGTEGGTNLHDGFKLGLEGLSSERTSAVLLVSDGGANVGPTETDAFLKLLERKDVRVFTFVMGQGANVPLLERLALESGGFTMGVSNEDDLYGRILEAKKKLSREALHGVRLEIEGLPVTNLAPTKLPSAYFGEQIVVFGQYSRPGTANVTLKALVSGEPREWSTSIVLPERAQSWPEIERLWALSRVRDLKMRIDDGGDKESLRRSIVQLGTTYSIVTDYTSMVAVRPERFDELGIERNNEKRAARERAARETRWQQSAPSTRADEEQPMFHGAPAGGTGAGAFGPEILGCLVALYAVAEWLRRRHTS